MAPVVAEIGGIEVCCSLSRERPACCLGRGVPGELEIAVAPEVEVQTHVVEDDRSRRCLCARRLADLRRAYFAQMGATHAELYSYGVNVERLAEHLCEALTPRALRRLRVEHLHIEDLSLAAACIDGDEDAWRRLEFEYEARLVRVVAAQHDETIQPVVAVRRMFIDLRAAAEQAEVRTALDLRRYTGLLSLDRWLYERLTGRLTVLAAIRRARHGQGQGSGRAHRLRHALELLRTERLAASRLLEAMQEARCGEATEMALANPTGSDS